MPQTTLHVNAPYVADRAGFERRAQRLLERNWLTNNGPEVSELEARCQAILGVGHCIAVASATTGMELVLRALPDRGEVILPAFTFVSTAGALVKCGFRPVFVDIDPSTGNLDPEAAEREIRDSTVAIIATHLWGRAADTQALERLAEEKGVALVFDAAHAFGARHLGKRVGSFGQCEVFSLHATKAVQGFEGGLITTDCPHLADQLRLLRNFGFSDYDDVTLVGSNGKMSEIHAAMANSNLVALQSICDRSQAVFEVYLENLADLPALTVDRGHATPDAPWQYVVVKTRNTHDRDSLLRCLHGESILARRYFYPGTHRLAPYRQYKRAELPNTERLAQRVLVLPGGASLEPRDAERVCEAVRRSLGAPTRVATMRSPAPGPPSVRPSVEVRIPVSPNDQFLRMVRYLVTSLRQFGGELMKSAQVILSVSAEGPAFPLEERYPWISDLGVQYRWVDSELFSRLEYDATGYDRYLVASDADIVIMADADLLAVGCLDDPILQAFCEGISLGALAHVSPFENLDGVTASSEEMWRLVFESAGTEMPPLKYEHTAWGLVSENPEHRVCPVYYNYGFVISPRAHVEKIAETFLVDLERVQAVVETWAASQVALTVAMARNGLPAGRLREEFNFPLHMKSTAFHRLNVSEADTAQPSQVKLFHYLGEGEVNKSDFKSAASLDRLLDRSSSSDYVRAFKGRLREIDLLIRDEDSGRGR